MRNIMEVIDSVKQEVPEDKGSFHEKLDWLKNDASYKAPEQMHEVWDKFASIIRRFITMPPTQDWHFKVLSIFSTKPEEELRKYYNA